jgi:hypothetical protein
MFGKWLVMNSAGLWRDVEVHAANAQTLHFIVDGACHDIAWSQFGALVEVWHEAFARAVADRRLRRAWLR